MTMRIRLTFLLLLAWTAPAGAAPGWTEFPVPEGSGPHDVAPAPDGMVWFTAQAAGALGRLDPRTGHVDEFPLGHASLAQTELQATARRDQDAIAAVQAELGATCERLATADAARDKLQQRLSAIEARLRRRAECPTAGGTCPARCGSRTDGCRAPAAAVGSDRGRTCRTYGASAWSASQSDECHDADKATRHGPSRRGPACRRRARNLSPSSGG